MLKRENEKGYSLVVLLVVLVCFFSSCQSESTHKVGLLIHKMEGRWHTDVDLLNEYAQNAGLEFVFRNADGNENMQLAQAGELIDEKVDVIIVVAANQNTAGGIVREAHKSKIPVIAYDRIIANSDLDYLITFEYKQIGEMLAKYAHSKVPKGNYVMLWGDAADNNALLMRKGQEEYLSPFIDRGDIQIIYRSYTEGWNDYFAEKSMERVLDFMDETIDVVLANNDEIALAALEAYDAYAGKQYPTVITGQDAILESCQSILNEGQTMTIYKSARSMAKETIGLAQMIVAGKKIKVNGAINNGRIDVPTMFMDPIIVDKENLESIILADGIYDYEQLFGGDQTSSFY